MRTTWIFGNHLEASYAVSLLQAEGFDAVLLDEGAFMYGAGPMRLQVPDHQVAGAVELLKTIRGATPEIFDGPADVPR